MKKILFLLALVLAFTACGKKAETQEDSKVLYLFNWSDYMPEEVLQNFEKDYKYVFEINKKLDLNLNTSIVKNNAIYGYFRTSNG